MSGEAEVSPSPASDGGEAAPLRVRPPRPVSSGLRAALAVAAVVLVVIGAVLVVQARSADDAAVVDDGRSGPPMPRAAKVDSFDEGRSLGEVDGFGTWDADPGIVVRGGVVTSEVVDDAVATVDAGSRDVLVHARVARATPGGGILLSATANAEQGLVLFVDQGGDGWQLVVPDGEGGGDVLGTYDAPTSDVVVEVRRQGDDVHVTLGTKGYDAKVPAGSAEGTRVGVAFTLPGTEFDRFGYLPLPAG